MSSRIPAVLVLILVSSYGCSGSSSRSASNDSAPSPPPSPPSALTATAVSNAKINLTWTASTDSSSVTAYLIERCTGASCSNFTQIATTNPPAYSDNGLSASTTYTYRVRATNAAGSMSAYSNVAAASTSFSTDAQAPTAPSALTATAVSSSQVNLSWTASTDDVGVASYLIERCTGSGCTNFVQVATAATTTYSDSALSPAAAYNYRVRAADAAGNTSGYSNVAAVSTPAVTDTQAPTAPSALTATAVSSSQINLSWTASTDNVGVSGYLIERCTGASCATFAQIATGDAAPAAFSNNALAAVTSYSYRIRATDVAGNLSGYSNVASATTSAASGTHTDVVTYKNDLARTGQNLAESVLTPANVNSSTFGLLRTLPADGAVYAQPLYLAQLRIGGTAHNVVFIATEHDSAYAYDADTGAQLWHTNLALSGETASDTRDCDQIQPELGVTATPVIDRSAGTAGVIYIVAMSKDSAGGYHQRLHALDVTNGGELFGGPREIQATYPTLTGTTAFDPSQYKDRAALLLLNGEIYTTWASHCDNTPYTGWIMAYSQSTLAQTRVFNLGPNSDGNGPGLWHGGGGPAVDSAGNVYIMAGNGAFETTLDANGFPSAHDFGNAFVKISTAAGQLAVADYFAPWNTPAENDADLDLGGSGPILLPDLTDGSGKVKHLVLGASKDGAIYVLDRDSMGGYNPSQNNIWQELDHAVDHGMRTTGAYFNGRVYFADWSATLKAFSITNAKLSSSPTSQSSMSFGYPGTSPVISANGNASGIVWAIRNNSGSAVLHAFDATNLGNELYNSNQAAGGRDQFGNYAKMAPPTVTDGKVFVESSSGVSIFGLLP